MIHPAVFVSNILCKMKLSSNSYFKRYLYFFKNHRSGGSHLETKIVDCISLKETVDSFILKKYYTSALLH